MNRESVASEIWKDIIGYENKYQVSNKGRVKSLYRKSNNSKIILIPYKSTRGYLYVKLVKGNIIKSYAIHRLVATAFIDNPNDLPQVNHKDEDKENNDMSILEWCDNKYNNTYKDKAKRTSLKCKKSILQLNMDGSVYKKHLGLVDAADYVKGKKCAISNCALGRRKSCYGYKWKYEE